MTIKEKSALVIAILSAVGTILFEIRQDDAIYLTVPLLGLSLITFLYLKPANNGNIKTRSDGESKD